MAGELTSVLGQISPADLNVDETGRVTITNERIASALKGALGRGGLGALTDSTNQSGCGNTQCFAPPAIGSTRINPA
jgi:hypothetical protein